MITSRLDLVVHAMPSQPGVWSQQLNMRITHQFLQVLPGKIAVPSLYALTQLCCPFCVCTA